MTTSTPIPLAPAEIKRRLAVIARPAIAARFDADATRNAARNAVDWAVSSGKISAFSGGYPRTTRIHAKTQCTDSGQQGDA